MQNNQNLTADAQALIFFFVLIFFMIFVLPVLLKLGLWWYGVVLG